MSPEAMASALLASEPHPDIPADQLIFSPFIGSWDLEVSWHEDGACVRREAGEWHFAWVLEGRAVQDVWIVPPRRLRAQAKSPYEYGASLRFYDPALGAWQSTWIGPTHAIVRTFIARASQQGVTLESNTGLGKQLRWIFSDIERDSFTWRNLEAPHGAAPAAAPWALVQSFTATRA